MVLKLFLAGLGNLAATLSCQAQTIHPPIEAYGSLPTVIEAEVSPDGSKVALIVNSDVGPLLIIYEVGKGITKRYDASQIRTNDVLWADEDTVVVKASEATRTWGFRGQYEYSAAIAMDLKSGKGTQLLSREQDLFPAQSGLGRIVGRLDDGKLLMPAYVGPRYSDPSLDLLSAFPNNGRARKVAKGSNDTLDWFVSGAGEPLFREDYDNRQDRYRVRFNDGRQWKEVIEIESDEIPLSTVAVSPDENGLYFIANTDNDGSFEALSILHSDGSITPALFSRTDADIDNVLLDINRKLFGIQYSGTFPSYDIVDDTLSASIDAMNEASPNSNIQLDSWSEDRSVVLYRVFDGFRVPYWMLHSVDTGSFTILSSTYKDIPREAVGIVYAIQYTARDGLTIPAVLTTPPGIELSNDVSLPLIVMPHGGPQAYDAFDFDWLSQYFANRGYLVLQPNFRGSTGYGGDFRNAGDGEWGGKMQDDVTDGVKAMISSGYADPDRVCIVGASYGGYSALMGGALTPDLYKCVAAVAPVTDLPAIMSESERDYGRDHWVISYWQRLMADSDDRRSKLKQISPVEHADKFKAPVLLIHGEDDTVVDYSQSRRMERALNRVDASVTLIKLRGGDHWLRDSVTRLETLQAIDTFVSENIGAGYPVGEPAQTD